VTPSLPRCAKLRLAHDAVTSRRSAKLCFASYVAAASPLLLAAGCIVVGPPPPPPPPPATIEFANTTSLDLTPNFYYSDTAADAEGLFVVANLNTSFIRREFAELRPGETASTTLACERTLSMGVSRPRLFNPAADEVIQSEDQIFLLRDRDFACGPTLRFVYFLEGGELRVRVEFP
jgi:hypothetical protein